MSKSLTGPARALSPLQSPLNAVCLTVRHLAATWILFLMPAVTVPPAATSNRTASPATLVTGSEKARFLPLAVVVLAAHLGKTVALRQPGVRDAARKTKKARDPLAVNSLRSEPPLPLNWTTRGDRACAPIPRQARSRRSSPAHLLRPRRLLRLLHRLRRLRPRLRLPRRLDPG